MPSGVWYTLRDRKEAHTAKGGAVMATSSIIENIRVNNPRVLEEYVDAMDRFAQNPHPRTEAEKTGVITDRSITDDFMRKALAKKGITL